MQQRVLKIPEEPCFDRCSSLFHTLPRARHAVCSEQQLLVALLACAGLGIGYEEHQPVAPSVPRFTKQVLQLVLLSWAAACGADRWGNESWGLSWPTGGQSTATLSCSCHPKCSFDKARGGPQNCVCLLVGWEKIWGNYWQTNINGFEITFFCFWEAHLSSVSFASTV